MTKPIEPPAVIEAREASSKLQKRLAVYIGGIVVFVLALIGAATAGAPDTMVKAFVGIYLLWALGGIPMLRAHKSGNHLQVIKEWESRALREEFDRFDRASQVAEDPRIEAAASMATRIRALDASPPSTDEMVTRLERRLGALVTDQTAASAAVKALEAAGAGSDGTGRLHQAAERLNDEISRILSGMSELYAALLEVDAGAGSEPDLQGVMAWLEAEAEIARATTEGTKEPADEEVAAREEECPARPARVGQGS